MLTKIQSPERAPAVAAYGVGCPQNIVKPQGLETHAQSYGLEMHSPSSGHRPRSHTRLRREILSQALYGRRRMG